MKPEKKILKKHEKIKSELESMMRAWLIYLTSMIAGYLKSKHIASIIRLRLLNK